MCGIAGVYRFDPENCEIKGNKLEKLVDALFVGIEPRGDHATGVATMDKQGNANLEKSDTPASTFIHWRRELDPNAQSILLHTRWATQGSPMNLLNNHPIQYENAFIIHNGHINNDDEIFEEEKLERLAQVDSEAIAALFNKYGMDKAHIPLQKLSGGFAVAVMDVRNPGELILAKGQSSPLLWFQTKDAVVWASTEKCLKDAAAYALNLEVEWKHINRLNDGDISYFKDGEYEALEFEVYKRKWKSAYTGGYGYSSYDHKKNKNDKDDKKKDKKDDRKSFSESWDDIDDICDGCYLAMSSSKLKARGSDWFCDKCIDAMTMGTFIQASPDVLINREPDEIIDMSETECQTRGKSDLDKELDEEHWTICELVAEKHKTTPEFIDWLLFNDEAIEEQSLVNVYMEASHDFETIQKELIQHYHEVAREVNGSEVGL